MATTGSAQSIISTTETLFEGFLVDNYKFIDINEAFHYMNYILSQDYKIPEWIIRVSHEDLYERIVNMFYDDVYIDEYEEPIRRYIFHLTEDEVTKIFYKNQLFLFIKKHKKLCNLFDKLFDSIENLSYAESVNDIPKNLVKLFSSSDSNERMIKDYNAYVNNQYFMDPNSPPDTIKDILKKLNEYCMTYVYVPYISIDRIQRLKFFKRKTVAIVDTDSNILALDSWIDFCKENLLIGDYGRNDENNVFVMINTLAYFITSAVQDILNEYGIYSNIPEDYRGRFTMKNEFEQKLIKNLSNCGEVLYIYIDIYIFVYAH